MMKDNAESGDGGEGGGEEMGNIYISSEQIIKEVQKYRCLYDPAVPEHKDRDVVRDAWLSVSQAVVGEPWESMNSAEKDEAVNELKKRWRQMKDTFHKSLTKKRFPSLCKGSQKPYCYYAEISFLLETEYKKLVPEGVDISAPVKKKEERPKEPPRPDFRIVHHSKNKFSRPRPTHSTRQLVQDKPLVREEPPSTSLPNIVILSEPDDLIQRQRVDNFAHQSTLASDPDRLFLLSMLPRVSALNYEAKMDFQINIMKLLQEYETDNS